MTRLRLLLAALGLILAGAAPVAAQQWCANGGLNLTERTICRDATLRSLDLQLGHLYDAVVNSAVRERQRAWLAYRNSCGADATCIANAYYARFGELQGNTAPPQPRPQPQPQANLRPWCANGGLNPTERTICATPVLADMDAAMAAIYGAARAHAADGSQIDWLRGGRDACSTNVECIGNAYIARIVDLGGRLRAAGN